MVESDTYGKAEAERRREAALKKMLATPSQPFTKKKKSPAAFVVLGSLGLLFLSIFIQIGWLPGGI